MSEVLSQPQDEPYDKIFDSKFRQYKPQDEDTKKRTNEILSQQPTLEIKPETYEKYFQEKFNEVSRPGDEDIEFDPFQHLSFYAEGEIAKHRYNETRRLTMTELALDGPEQCSQIGVTDPFPLFTDEAVRVMKQEILNKDTFMKYCRHSYLSKTGKDCIMRGYCRDNQKVITPFTYAAWTHPMTTALVSEMAGVELEVIFDYEIAHVNMSVKEPEQAEKELEMYKDKKPDDDYVVQWHKDSYPFVCVMMLSDTTKMLGGETCLRTGKGIDDVVAVPGPTRGFGFVLQGGMIQHIAPNPMGTTERITMVTSYKAKDPYRHDASTIYTVKPEIYPGSRVRDFYGDWVEYRSKTITERLSQLNSNIRSMEVFDKDAVVAELETLTKFLESTYTDMIVSENDLEYVKKHSSKFKK